MNYEIIYIYHSCFILKTDRNLLVFDYYKDPNNQGNQTVLDTLIKNVNSVDNIFIFSSHSHEDHFNSIILTWKEFCPNIKYIFSDDIKINEESPDYHFLAKGNELHISNIYVKAYDSSDIGVSFLVQIDGLTLFHAGDLNWWHWPDDNQEEEAFAEGTYKEIIESIKDFNNRIDVAFFPVDPRLEEYYNLGGEYFAKTINPKIIVPMHFDENFHITKEFKLLMDKYNITSAVIKETWQKII